MLTAAFYNDQDMEATSMSIDRGMNKEDTVHTHNWILLSQNTLTLTFSLISLAVFNTKVKL